MGQGGKGVLEEEDFHCSGICLCGMLVLAEDCRCVAQVAEDDPEVPEREDPMDAPRYHGWEAFEPKLGEYVDVVKPADDEEPPRRDWMAGCKRCREYGG